MSRRDGDLANGMRKLAGGADQAFIQGSYPGADAPGSPRVGPASRAGPMRLRIGSQPFVLRSRSLAGGADQAFIQGSYPGADAPGSPRVGPASRAGPMRQPNRIPAVRLGAVDRLPVEPIRLSFRALTRELTAPGSPRVGPASRAGPMRSAESDPSRSS